MLRWLKPVIKLTYKFIPRPKINRILFRFILTLPETQLDYIYYNFNKGSYIFIFCKY